MPKPSRRDSGDTKSKVCNVCHLPYADDECPVCKAEREHAAAVIEERGRRHRKSDDDEQ
jgi:rubrerythrin